MKKSLVALATMSVVASAFADVDVSGGVKLYGVLDQSIQNQRLTDASTGTATNQTGLFASAATSRLGVKASRDLGDGFKGVAQAEIQLDPDTATLLPNKNRTAFVGLQNESAGSIMLGSMETTAYEVFGMDVNGRVEYKPQVWRTTASNDTQDRANNAVKYITPEFGGFTGHVMMGFSEAPDTNSTANEFTSYGIKFHKDKLKAAFLTDKLTNTAGSYKFAGILNAGVVKDYYVASSGTTASSALVYAASGNLQRDIGAISYEFDAFTLNYIYAKSYTTDTNSGNLTTNTIGVRIPFEKVTVAFSTGTGNVNSYQQSADNRAAYGNTKARSGSIADSTLGIYYNFDKSTQVYVLTSYSTSTGVGYSNGKNQTTATGVRYNF
jgi:predicted porin